jgi:hypothetical protein
MHVLCPASLLESSYNNASTVLSVQQCQYSNASTREQQSRMDLFTKIFNAGKKSLKGKPCRTNFPAWEISNAAQDLRYLTKISYYNRYRNTKEKFACCLCVG